MRVFAILLSLVLLLFLGHANAANHYIRSSGGGGGGTTWTDAYSGWPTTFTRGDTYYMAGGSYASKTFNTAVSGSLLITILKATISDHGTDTGWNDTYASTIVSIPGADVKTSYWTFDGSTGGGPGEWDTGFGMEFITDGDKAFRFTSGTYNNITFRHLSIYDVVGNTRPRSSAGGADVDLIYVTGANPSNWLIEYCYLHDTNRTMLLTWPSPITGITIQYSKFARNGITEHVEAWSGQNDSDVVIANNIFEDIAGTGQIGLVNGSGNATNWDIHGNVFFWNASMIGGSVILNSGLFDVSGTNIGAANWWFYNNVIVGIYGFNSTLNFQHSVTNVNCFNNVWYNNRTDATGCGGSPSRNYNWFYNNRTENNSSNIDSTSKGSETNSIIGISNPFTNWTTGDFSLTAAISGSSLLSPTYNAIDSLGITRGADSVWDMGAYEYIGSKMVLIPTSGLSSSGFSGGPFSPGSAGYTLTNTEGNTISWSVTSVTQPTPSWLTFSAITGTISGTIQNSSDSDSVTLSINSNANALASGVYNDTITWTNATDNAGTTTTSVTLTVNLIGGGGQAVNGRNSVGVRSRPAVSGRTPVAGRRNH